MTASTILELIKTNPELAGTLTIEVKANDLKDFAELCINKGRQEKQYLPPEKETEKPISQVEAIRFLGKSRQTLISWRKKGVISAHRLGGRIYYLKSELIGAMK